MYTAIITVSCLLVFVLIGVFSKKNEVKNRL